MALNLNNIMLGSEDSKKLADFYAKVLGAPNPDWSDEANGWFGFQAGDAHHEGRYLPGRDDHFHPRHLTLRPGAHR